LKVWIDATHHGRNTVFGMTLLERMLRSLVHARRQISPLVKLEKELKGLGDVSDYVRSFVERQLAPSEVRIELAAGTPIPALPSDLLRELPLVWSTGDATSCERLAQATEDAEGEPLLALSADTIVDVRLIEHLAFASTPRAFFGERERTTPTAFRIDGALPEDLVREYAGADLASLAQACVDRGFVKEFSADDFKGYIVKLRRTLPAYVLPVRDRADADAAEHFLFHSNYKGATDFLTKHVFPPLVWRIVHPLAARRIKPNTVTIVGILCCFAAVPLFAAGYWLPGLALSYAMAVLDSVDGKLARVTFTSSKQGDVLDHGTDYVHPPIWYFAWAWGLSGGDPYSTVFQASVWLAGLYILDRLLETLFKSCTGGRSVQDYTPLDTRLRTFVSRRNVNLALFTIALPFGLGLQAFYAIVALQAATVVYHLIRVVQFWDAGDAPPPTTAGRAAAPTEAPAPRQVAWSSEGVTEA